MRKPFYVSLAVAFTVAAAALPIRAFNESIDYDAINKIKQQGLVPENSKVMETMSWLTDAAMEPWTADSAGNNNGFPRGWYNEKFYMAAVSPQAFPIVGTPTGWTPGTNGLVRGSAMMVTENTLEELKSKYAGKLRGAW